MEYYIFVTNSCNLNCSYCSVMLKMEENNIPLEPIYSLNDLNHFIDITQKKYKDTVADIIFFGGEPTLNYKFIQDIITSHGKLYNLSYKFHYMLHTNGLLLCQIPDDILQVLDSIMVSINYDKIPHKQLNDGYFKVIIDAIHYIRQRKKLSIIARLTITEETSLYSEIALLNSFFDAIYWQIENKYSFKDYSSFYNTYKYELNLTFYMWLNYLKRGILINLIPFISSTYFFTNEHNIDSFCCGYNNSMIYIQTNGQCYTCAEDMLTTKNLIGTIDKEIQFHDFNIKNTICYSCPYLNMCLGRCGRMHKEFTKEHIQEYCNLNKILFDLVKENCQSIQYYCKQYNLSLGLDNPIYHYTEYTP